MDLEFEPIEVPWSDGLTVYSGDLGIIAVRPECDQLVDLCRSLVQIGVVSRIRGGLFRPRDYDEFMALAWIIMHLERVDIDG